MSDAAQLAAPRIAFAPAPFLRPARARCRMCWRAAKAVGRGGRAARAAQPARRAVGDGGSATAPHRRAGAEARRAGHTAADNALYLAGLVRESRGDCGAALALFEAVPQKYPAGDAVPQAMLERGRCLRILGRKDEAKAVLMQMQREHPEAAETAQGRQLLQE